MHELAIAESVVTAVLERTEGRRVEKVRLRVGALTAVVPDALTFCFELAAAGTPLDGASLEIVAEPARVHCRSCGSDSCVQDAVLLCDCGSADVGVLSGRELQVMSVAVAGAAPTTGGRP